MKITAARLAGAMVIEPEPHRDARGFFARTFCEREFAAAGLVTHFPQHSISYNARRGTVRGLHYQEAPHSEAKIVRCTAGAIFDVIVDIRAGSPTRGEWQAFELTHTNRTALYIPEGFAHGFQALADETEVSYLISAFHVPEAARGYRYDEHAFAVRWPLAVTAISDRDQGWPAFPG